MTAHDRDPDSLDTYAYELPEELIATEPPERRDG
jgi:S-adenosylmethionine:tRNA-ribosyltransferase-isomerase (queuine synthetase)